MPIKGIIFDWDGVIADSFSLQYDHMKDVCLENGKKWPFKSYEELKEFYHEPFPLMYNALGFVWEKDREIIEKHFIEHSLKTDVQIYPNLREEFFSLHEKGFKLGIAS